MSTLRFAVGNWLSATFGATIDDVWPEFAGQQRCNFGLWYCDVVELHTAPLKIDGIDCEDGGVMGYSTTNQESFAVDRRTEGATVAMYPARRGSTRPPRVGRVTQITLFVQHPEQTLG
jgi:hypothetical protein